jgi:ADP-ribose pyrophosphatase YjhB (NUDIX family)
MAVPTSAMNIIDNMAVVHERFGTATAKFTPKLVLEDNGNTVKDLGAFALGDERIRTVVVKCDMSPVIDCVATTSTAKPRIACVDPVDNTLTLVIPTSEQGDVFPDGVHHSKSVACIVWREDDQGNKQLLLVTEKCRDYTSYVAGGLKWKENSLHGCVREVKEEVGLDVDMSTAQWIATVEMPRAVPYGEINTLTTFACRAVDAWMVDPVLQDTEIKDAKWYDVNEALDILPFESARKALRAFVAGKGRPVEDGKWTAWFCDDA